MRNTSTLPAHEEEAASRSLSNLFFLDSSTCRWLLESYSPYRAPHIRLQLGHRCSELGLPNDTTAEWPTAAAIVIKSQQAGWETLIDPSHLSQERLNIPWSEHLDWYCDQIDWHSDDLIGAYPHVRSCTRVSRALEDPPTPSLPSGRFPESIWIDQNLDAIRANYAGLWIAVEEASVIALGYTELEALEQAERVGHDAPYTFYVPSDHQPAPMA